VKKRKKKKKTEVSSSLKSFSSIYSSGFKTSMACYHVAVGVQGYCFGLVGANLATRVRELFLEAVLRQEIGWFDLDANTSRALTARLSQDAPAVRGAVADVMGIIVQNLSSLIAGYVIAFTNGWKMTLVVTAAIPVLGFTSYLSMKFFTGVNLVLYLHCCMEEQNKPLQVSGTCISLCCNFAPIRASGEISHTKYRCHVSYNQL
jgi:ABC-type multidrug transport system fused ATPase/permease subunit